MPLSIGFIAAYAQKKLGTSVEFKLFKYPESLLDALERETPDVIGFSNYVWNDHLNEFVCETIKKKTPQIITVKGGPNFPLTAEDRTAYLRSHPHTDYYFIYEGEEAFAVFLERLLDGGIEKNEALPNCAYLGSEDQLVLGDILPRITDLDVIPSPYLDGLMDEFFDGKLVPMLETTRGCPFSCNYCNAGVEYYSKTRAFSTERVFAELNYMGAMAKQTGLTFLLITDMNFGMFARDEDVAKEIVQCQGKYNWPFSVYIETGKNRIDNVSRAVGVLKNCVEVKLSLQSNSQEVLKEIRRQNIDPESYWRLCRQLNENGRAIVAELILPLPLETRASYLQGIKFLMDSGVDRIVNYTLQINYGTVYTDKSYLDKYKYQVRYRPYANCFGRYAGFFVIEGEQVGVSTDTISFSDYLDLRAFSLMIEVLYNNDSFKELLRLLEEFGGDDYLFILFCFENRVNNPVARQVFDSFMAETAGELFPSLPVMAEFFEKEENYTRLVNGEIGRNVMYSNFAIIMSQHHAAFVNFIGEMLNAFVKDHIPAEHRGAIEDLKTFMLLKGSGLFNPEMDDPLEAKFIYDWPRWYKDKSLRLPDVKIPVELVFYFSDHQLLQRADNFRRYRQTPAGLAKIVAHTKPIDLFRQIKYASH